MPGFLHATHPGVDLSWNHFFLSLRSRRCPRLPRERFCPPKFLQVVIVLSAGPCVIRPVVFLSECIVESDYYHKEGTRVIPVLCIVIIVIIVIIMFFNNNILII